MIQIRTHLDVADNTGARVAWAIGVLGHQKRYARVGDVIKAHVKEATPDGTVKKGEVVTAVVVRTKSALRRADGSYLRFDNNAVVMIDAQMNPTRHAHFRAGGPRTARQKFHQDHFAGARGVVMKVKKNDMVVVLWGEEKGKVGKVLATYPAQGRVLVEGINTVHKALRKSKDRPHGGIITKEGPVAAAKVMLQERYEARRKKRGGVPSRRMTIRVGESASAPSFQKAALPLLEDAQLRKNVRHATDVIQRKRAQVVHETPDCRSCAPRRARSRRTPCAISTTTDAIREGLHRGGRTRALGLRC